MATVRNPPVWPKIPVEHKLHGDVRLDNFAWTRNKKDPQLLELLQAENDYTSDYVANSSMGELQQECYDEFLKRINQTDISVPTRKGKFLYYHRTEKGKNYRIHCRQEVLSDSPLEVGPEQVLLDVNELAVGKEYCEVGIFRTSPDHKFLAIGEDNDGDELFALSILDIQTSPPTLVYKSIVEDISYYLEWSADGKYLFYVRVDEALRTYQIWRHEVGTDSKQDVLIFEEPDEKFNVMISKTADDRFLLIGSGSCVTSEYQILPADNPLGTFRLVKPRVQDEEYSVETHKNNLFLLTNANGKRNFFLLSRPLPSNEEILNSAEPISGASLDGWTEIYPHSLTAQITGVDPYEDFVVLTQQSDGLPRIVVIPMQSDDLHANVQQQYHIQFQEPAYFCCLLGDEFISKTLRFRYSSFITPPSVYQHVVSTREQTLLKQETVFDYDASNYTVERIETTSHDGVKVPISLVRKKDLALDGNARCVLFGYGAYGLNYDATFSAKYFSFVDRGFIVAIAHIRGGGDNGRYWYEDGKLLRKKNTFLDFLASAKHLIDHKYTSADNLAIYGASAGGLLIGAALNMATEKLFSVAVASVPFVDVVTTLLDETLPLTISEWEEWGNPKDEEYYHYLKSYSPYDNVSSRDYPHLLILGGLNDSRVHISEPAKYCAKLRDTKTDQNLLLMKTKMGSGHFGASGRYEYWKEEAFEYAFILNQLKE